ncbi:hypothetical protein HOP50_02g15110 [Chloropicon primus]|uniref:C2 domain-containing protein n=1 Tax=Chloropicon primus TaxID=1764295 RepID=A0A5B8MEW6_9CHLO|nr:hypothetical protein A3770_02p15210 [Chloropicon primus]UPQ98211.1 hypothetical protein HOP50_02g15110 [Chloropicon primus]|eukprot:QDZ19003.1 hypothetical protein A3770_02p15210 [Chloropicon primus]
MSTSSRGPGLDCVVRVHESRNVVDKGEALNYCVCVVSIVRTSYESLQEEVLDRVRYVSAPAHRQKLKLARPQVWKQTSSKECSIHWQKHNPREAFALSLRPRSGRLYWTDGSEEDRRGGRVSDVKEEEMLWNLTNMPRVKLEVYGVGSPSSPKEKFLGQAYLSWREITASLDASSRSPDGSTKVFLQMKPRNLKSRVGGYFVLSVEPALLPRGGAAPEGPTRAPSSYMKRMVLYCQVIKVENLRGGSVDPYVLVETQPASEFSRAARTRTKFQSLDPVFEEAFLFCGLRPELRDLRLSVWDENTGAKHACLGHITIPLEAVFHNQHNMKSYDHSGEEGQQSKVKDCTMVFELQQETSGHKDQSQSLLHLSLWFGTGEETLNACGNLERGIPGNVGDAVFYEPELRKLHVDILKAKNLPPKVKKNGYLAGRDSYCTVSMTGGPQKNSTQIQRSTLWPEFNEKFALMVAQNQLHKCAVKSGGLIHDGPFPAASEGSLSHRSKDIGFNNPALLSMVKKLGTRSPILTIKMFDYEPLHQSLGGGDRLIGKLKVPVSNLPTSVNGSTKPQWQPLVGGSGIKGMKYNDAPPELYFRACFEREDCPPAENKRAIGSVSITLKKVYLEPTAASIASERGGLYCLVKYGKELVKTPCRQTRTKAGSGSSLAGTRRTSRSARSARDSERSEYNDYQSLGSIATHRSSGQGTGRLDYDLFSHDDSLQVNDLQIFKFGDRCAFPVCEPSSLISVGIFDNADMKLSKIQMRLSTFLRRSNRMLYPISIDMPENKETLHVGYLEFSITIKYDSKLDLWARYFTLTQPSTHYTDPLPLKVRYNAQVQEHELLKASVSRGPKKLSPDVGKVMLDTENIKFSIACLQARIASITESVKNLIPVDLTKLDMYNPITWEKPWLSTVIAAAACLAIQYAEYLLPVTFLLLVVAGLFLRKFQRQIILYELSRLSKTEEAKEGAESPGKTGSQVSDLMKGLKLDTPVVLDDQTVLDEEDEKGQGADFCIPDFESNSFNVDCFWQEESERIVRDRDGKDSESRRQPRASEKKLARVKRKVEILKLTVEDKLLTVKTKAGSKINVVKVKMGGRVDGVKIKLEDKLKHINKALKTKFPHLEVKLRDIQSANRTLKESVKDTASKVKSRVGHAVSGVRNKAGEVFTKAGGAIDGVKDMARKEMLAVRRRAGFVVMMDKYVELKKQYNELKSYSGITQMMLGDLNKGLQNVRGLILWTDPRVSFFCVFGCFLSSLFLFWFGLKVALQLSVLYVLRPPFLQDPLPPVPLIPFFRMASVQESPLWCYLGIMQKKADVNNKKEA